MSGVPRAITLTVLGIIILSFSVSARNLDINKDGRVDIIDATAVQNNIGSRESVYDVDNDGAVTTLDFDLVFKNIGLDCGRTPVSCDYDNDGVFSGDYCPNTPEAEASGVFRGESFRCTGCGISERDVDYDGVIDLFDRCIADDKLCVNTRSSIPVDQFGCTQEQGSLLLEDLFIPADKIVYSTQIKQRYSNIYIYGRLEVVNDTLNLTADNDFILDGIINANGGPGEPGKGVALAAKRFFIEGTEIDLGKVSCEADAGNNIKFEHPSIYEDKIVFSANNNENRDIYLYDLTTKKKTRITSSQSQDANPSIYKNKIVFSRIGAETKEDWDIYLYDLTTNIETPIITRAGGQSYPSLYEDKFVFEDGGDIYLLDLASNKETQITTDAKNRLSPSIYGNKIVWQVDFHLYLYDLSTNKEIPIISDENYRYTASLYEDKIVFVGSKDGWRNIYLYDLTANKETKITADQINGVLSYNPSMYKNKIVFGNNRDRRGSLDDLYVYDLITNKETKIDFSANDQCLYAGPNADLINRHILREANDGGFAKQCTLDAGSPANLNQRLQESCGWCGTKTAVCEHPGIWGSQSSCLNQGMCDPNISYGKEVLFQGEHIKRAPDGSALCVGNKINIVETFQTIACTDSCSYEYGLIDRPPNKTSVLCLAGECRATCSTGASGECGKCGTLSCDSSSCSPVCQNEGQCYPGQIQRETCGQCGVFEQACGEKGTASQCQWETTQACRELVVSEPGCDAPGKTRTVGNCEQQVCTVRCDLSGTDGKPILYWKTSAPAKEYPPNSESPPDVEIEGLHTIGCEGNLSVYAKTMQRKATDASCNIVNSGTYNITVEKREVAGQCGACSDGAVLTSGQNACASVSTCINGQWAVTQAGRTSSTEICDGIDNDCDGSVDESHFQGTCSVTAPPQPEPRPAEISCNYGCADLDQSGEVNFKDLSILQDASDSQKGDPYYNQLADWDNNGIVELTRSKPDIACFSRYFGVPANKDFGPACNKCNDLDNGDTAVAGPISFPSKGGKGVVQLMESCSGQNNAQELSCINQFDYAAKEIPCTFGCDSGTGACRTSPQPAADCSCATSDLNSNGVVDVLDITVISQRFANSQLYHQAADLNSDGQISVLDIAAISQCFGKNIDASCPDVSIPPLP